MFKNMKKKAEESGTDLTTLASPGTLGSSLSNLRRSESKSSTLSRSRESIHSESSRVIRTSSISSDEPSSKPLESSVPLSLALDSDSRPDVTINNKQILADIPSFSEPVESLSDGRKDPAYLVDEPILDSSPVLVPVLVEESHWNQVNSFAPEFEELSLGRESVVVLPEKKEPNYVLEKESRAQQTINRKDAELTSLKKQLSSKDFENINLRAELDRLKDMVARNRVTEEKLSESNSKLADLQLQLDNLKLERNSWKIVHDESEKELKDKDNLVAAAQKKTSDLQTKLNSAKTLIAKLTGEGDKFREEHKSVKATVVSLEQQLDKLTDEVQIERDAKETALVRLKEQHEMERILEDKEKELTETRHALFQERAAKEATMSQLTEQNHLERNLEAKQTELVELRCTLEETSRCLEEEYNQKADDARGLLQQKDTAFQEMLEQFQAKIDEMDVLQSNVHGLEARIKSLQEDLDSKDSALTIFRRRSAKDTESKLRERDKQIANLERQLEDLSERVSTVVVTDTTSEAYMKNVMLKFFTGSLDERLQLIRAVSVLLKLTEAEELWLKEMISWKHSWLPAPKPELTQYTHGSNGL